MMDPNLKNEVATWAANAGVTVVHQDDQDLIELTWNRPSGELGYIDVFAENDVVILQHGIITTAFVREQCGVATVNRMELTTSLSEAKSAVDSLGSDVKRWKYSPTIDIASVASLKLR